MACARTSASGHLQTFAAGPLSPWKRTSPDLRVRALPRDLEPRIGVDHAAIDRDGVANHIVARARGQINRNSRHVLIGADALRRNTLCKDIAMVTRGLVHVGCEGARRDRGDVDVL